jgi:zinc transport system ATP-binding protein
MSALPAPGPTVVCRGVSLAYGKNRVLDTIDLTAEPGAIHCIIGPNGGGKSSVIKSLLGQTRHTGEITIGWENGARTIGYVPQVVAIDKTMPLTVMDFMTLCVQNRAALFGLKRSVKKVVAAILADVKMDGKETFLFSELSGGERQRVLFAQALIPAPRLLVLDEPMQSIDESGYAVFTEIIRNLAAAGATIIWVHHDLAQVRKIAQTVSCINRTVIFSGKPSTVMTEENLFQLFAVARAG